MDELLKILPIIGVIAGAICAYFGSLVATTSRLVKLETRLDAQKSDLSHLDEKCVEIDSRLNRFLENRWLTNTDRPRG